jgi:5-deoxy-glucuronate isomerase
MANPSQSLIIHPSDHDDGVVMHIDPAIAGWEHLHFEVRQLHPGATWEWDTGDNELGLVVLGGTCAVRSNRGEWPQVGERQNVFSGLPHALYLPRHTTFVLTATSPCEIAYAWVAVDADFPARLITPVDVGIEIRGGDNMTRQINGIIHPGFPCGRLVMVEVYTPAGNWSSFPPHKHDVHREDADGTLIEADLEEVYFYRFERPGGFAYQRVYTSDGTTDELLFCRDCDLVLVPHGYHPVVGGPGATTYYLNFLAGSAQSLTATDDPTYAWIKDTFVTTDPRVPVYPVGHYPRPARTEW